jgi:hypothetical protein
VTTFRALLALVAAIAVLGFGLAPTITSAADEAPHARPVKTIDEALSSGRISKETVDALRS